MQFNETLFYFILFLFNETYAIRLYIILFIFNLILFHLEKLLDTSMLALSMMMAREGRNITSYLHSRSQKITLYAMVEPSTSKFLGEQLAFYGYVVKINEQLTVNN